MRADRLWLMERLRICQLITELRPAGAERCVYELAHRLDERRFDVHVAALRGGAVAEWLERAGVGVTVLGVRGRADVAKLGRLVRVLKERRIQLLHTHLFHADLAGRMAARRAGVRRLVHTVHVAEARFRPWQFMWARLARGRCDRIVCVSQAVREHHQRRSRLDASHYQVIHNGIDAAAYARSEPRRAQLRDDWGIAPDETLLAFVGRLDRQKNVGMFLEAAGRARRSGRRVRAVLAGDGPERGQVRAFLATGDNRQWARWLGYTEDVPGVLSAADVLVQPSRWEGFGLAAAEAMAAGLPVIGTRVAGLTEVIGQDVTGLLVESEDTVALAEAIGALADDPDRRAQLGRAGPRRVARQFSIEANVAAHESLYESLAANGCKPPA